MNPTEGAASSAPTAGASGEAGVMEKASLEVKIDISTPQGPALYEATYTRGGWIWRTSHRFREWLALKDSLKKDYGTRNLPDESTFPRKEDMGAMVNRLLHSCQGCQESGTKPFNILEERRQGLEAYFSTVLDQHREVWDGSDAVKCFFFPGPPTSYSKALARRRSIEINEEKIKTRVAPSTGLNITSSFKSLKFSMFESSSPSPMRPASGSFSGSLSAEQGTAAVGAAATTPKTQLPPPVTLQSKAAPTTASSMMSMISSKMPSLRDVLFNDSPRSSKSSSRHGAPSNSGAGGGSSHGFGWTNGSHHSSTGGFGRPHPLPPSSINKSRSESGATDPDGISDAGGSKHSMWD